MKYALLIVITFTIGFVNGCSTRGAMPEGKRCQAVCTTLGVSKSHYDYKTHACYCLKEYK